MTHPHLNPDGLYLALGGGAARGLAHLGVLIAFEKHKIPIAGICGASMGALVGGCYALAPNAEQVAQDFIDYVASEHFQSKRYAFIRAFHRHTADSERTLRQKLTHGFLVGRSLATGSIMSFEDYRSEINALISDKTFKDLKMPFFAVAVDLTNFKEIVFTDGRLRAASLASSAIPGAFPPVRCGEVVYIDGGWMNQVPVEPLIHFGAVNTLAIDVSEPEDTDAEINTRRGLPLMSRANDAAKCRLRELQMQRASLIWQPPIGDLHWAEFMRVESIIEAGRLFAEERMDEVKALLDRPKRKRFIGGAMGALRAWLEPPPPATRPSFETRAIWSVASAEDTL